MAITATLRRRRAKRFDAEIDAAAAEAATAPVPVFLDDEDDNYGPGYARGYGEAGSAYGGVGGYSDVSSHGTYGQPAMSQESYPMSERPPAGPGPGGIFDHSAAYGAGAAGLGAGAAGIGVARARSTRDGAGYAAALSDGSSPYPAFATPGHYDMYNNVGMAPMHPQSQQPPQGYYGGSADPHGPYRGYDAAAMGGAGLAGAAVAHHHTGNSGSDLSRMKSDASRSDYGPSYTSPQSESYAAHYEQYPPNATGSNPTDLSRNGSGHGSASGGSGTLISGGGANAANDAAYGGYADSLPNPFSSPKHEEESSEEGSSEEGRRVLKVANAY